jgi:hypothetical protein
MTVPSIWGFTATLLVDSSGLIASITGENVLVSIRLVWIERNVLVGLVPHALRPSTTPLAISSAAFVVDRMAMAGSGRLGFFEARDAGCGCRCSDANRERLGALICPSQTT